MLANPQAAAVLADIIADAHARLVGAGGPVQITGQHMVEIVRYQFVAALPAVSLPVETISSSTRCAAPALLRADRRLGRLVAVGVRLLAHPGGPTRCSALGCSASSPPCSAMVLGYVVPTFLLPVLRDTCGSRSIPAVADDQLPMVAGVSCALAVLGGVLILASTGFRRRKTSWSAPVGITRYSDQRRWS